MEDNRGGFLAVLQCLQLLGHEHIHHLRSGTSTGHAQHHQDVHDLIVLGGCATTHVSQSK